MRVGYHSAVQKEVNRALRRYDEISLRLGDSFWEEVNRTIAAGAEKPLRFHPVLGDLRRANLKRFPYHVLYRVLSDGIRVIALRHHRQHPRTGLDRR